jgi:murein DD-endopeptidase MepM/ murein hydrolase activator NlpD
MINSYGQIAPTYAPSGTNVQTKIANSSSSNDFLASFKEILATMTTMNSMSGSMSASGEQSAGLGMSDLMAPLMMVLLEKMIEQQLDTSALTPASEQTGVQTNALPIARLQSPKNQPSGRPVAGVLTQDFHPGHNGLDFGVVVGTPIKTTMDGKVAFAGSSTEGYGNLVIVENGPYRTYYAHLSSIPVAVGDSVAADSTIGLSGNTGHSTGPHLHYEIRKNNVPIDPTSVTLGTSA